MENFFGSPWDFGTGFMPQQSFLPGTMNQPVMPQVDLATQMAQGLASQGIRPQQFFSNPEVARDVLQPPAAPSPWDTTPVDTPRGAPIAPQGPVATAMAAGTPEEIAAAAAKTPAEKFAEGLRGVKAPVPPAVQKVGTPAAPRPTGGVKAGELLALLLGQQPAQPRVPVSLGSSLAGIGR